MVKRICDICGKEIWPNEKVFYYGTDLMFDDIHGKPIVDVCIECHRKVYCCLNMMKETSWKPYFQDVLITNSLSRRMHAEYVLDKLEDRTGLDLHNWVSLNLGGNDNES